MTINIPEFEHSPYSLIVIASVLTGFAAAVLLMRKFKVSKQTILYTSLLTLICTLVISLMSSLELTENGLELGFSGLGAVVGMALGILVSGLIFKDKPEYVLASFAAAAPLMYGLSKTGCLLAGCCHGKPYNGPFAIVNHGYHAGSFFPAQLVDMAVFFILHIIALILVIKMENKLKAVYILIAIALPVRFATEYLRYTNTGILDKGQIKVLVAGAISIGIVVLWKKLLKVNNR